ncbi:hypothetical protein QR680_012594 [Steinernema hermaphroditum]|uniref:G-protein alpha subunit n=1 Tax=Steinernema hermaphroditum TaxID=289476 RepID=A0AA39I4I5_9BILA|nr:hypothetical protein QR680_012594 [Steinernema hermaphroditum]
MDSPESFCVHSSSFLSTCPTFQMWQAIQRCFTRAADETAGSIDPKKQPTVHRFLMLGIGSVGKSTIIKQLMSLCERNPRKYKCCDQNWNPKGTDIEEIAAKAYAKQIRGNVIEAFVIFIKYAEQENQKLAEDLREDALELVENFEDDPLLFDGDENTGELLVRLFEDKAIQYSVDHKNNINLQEYRLFDGFSYFVKSEKIKASFLLIHLLKPKWADLVYSRKATVDYHDFYFMIHGERFEINDIGGQESERRNVTHHFDRWYGESSNRTNVKMFVLFVTSLSDFDEVFFMKKQPAVHRDDPPPTQLDVSIAYFNVFLTSPFAKTCSILIFFNKQDRFKEKLEDPECKKHVERYLAPHIKKSAMRKYLETGKFDLDEMSKAVSAKLSDKISGYVREFQKNIYSRFTTAVDSKMMEGIFAAMKDQTISDSLNDGSFLP